MITVRRSDGILISIVSTGDSILVPRSQFGGAQATSTACSCGGAAKSLRSGWGMREGRMRWAEKGGKRICWRRERRMDTGSWRHQAMRAALGAGLGRTDRFRKLAHPPTIRLRRLFSQQTGGRLKVKGKHDSSRIFQNRCFNLVQGSQLSNQEKKDVIAFLRQL